MRRIAPFLLLIVLFVPAPGRAQALGDPSVTPPPAQHRPVSGPYVAGSLGGDLMPDTDARSGWTAAPVAKPDPGGAGVGSLGYGLGNGVRMEMEGNYRVNSLH